MDANECARNILTTMWDRTEYLKPEEIGQLEAAIISCDQTAFVNQWMNLIYLSEVRSNDANTQNGLGRMGFRIAMDMAYPLMKGFGHIYNFVSRYKKQNSTD